MIRRWISLGVLCLLVIALAAWVLRKPKAPDSEAHALSTLTAAQVTRIRLERVVPASAPGNDASTRKPSAATTALLERQADGWHMVQPVTARADAFTIERLLAMLDARSLARYPAKDLARYGLEEPIARVTFNDETFSFGAVNTMTREQYVLAQNGVYAIPLSQRTTLPRDAPSLISRALFAPDETPVRFALADFTATLADGRWTFDPAGEDPGPDERNGWVAAWRQANAARAQPYDGRKPLSDVNVTLQDGRTIHLGVLQREPEFVLLRSDERIEYHFLAETGKRLLSPPGVPRSEPATK
jgi:hypothetical protein